MNDRFWTRFFAFAGIFNLIVGLVLMIDPSLMGKSWSVLPPDDWFFLRIAGAAITAFGIGYLMVAADLDRHRGIVWIGVIGKALVILVTMIYWIDGTIGFRTVSLALVDLIFVLGFLRFLTRYAAR